MFDATYILPVKWLRGDEPSDFEAYLHRLREWVTVIVVDGSDADEFDAHARRWGTLVRHVRVEAPVGMNGKVAGVMTGVHLAQHKHLIVADDDVRYTRESLAAVLSALRGNGVVRPQNYFVELPWHSRWDTARSLINRAFDADYPGTLAVHRDLLMSAGGYDGDVLFENLELIRTIRAAGGRELKANHIFVGRLPPSSTHFWKQRVRQAYDDFAQPARLVTELALLPALLCGRRHPWSILVGIAASVGAAEWGRRRGGATAVFPASSSLWAPAWVFERAICVWIALAERSRGGVMYAGKRVARAATSSRQLRKRLRTKSAVQTPVLVRQVSRAPF